MDTSGTVMVVVSAVITIIVGIWVISTVITSSTLPTVTTANESVNFALNNTYYTLAHPYGATVTAVYADAGLTQAYPAAQYLGTDTQVKIIANGTLAWPNSTNGTSHYVAYTHQSAISNSSFSSATTTVFNSITLLGVALIVIAASVILAYFGFGMSTA